MPDTSTMKYNTMTSSGAANATISSVISPDDFTYAVSTEVTLVDCDMPARFSKASLRNVLMRANNGATNSVCSGASFKL